MLPILRVPEGKQQYMEQQQNMMIQEQVDIHESTTASQLKEKEEGKQQITWKVSN